MLIYISRTAYDILCREGYGNIYSAAQFIDPLNFLVQDNSDKSADELQRIASTLTPGSLHNNDFLYRIAMSVIDSPCSKLRAAIIARTWGGGKFGFQHMPDPKTTNEDDYEFEGDMLLYNLGKVRPEDVLVGKDRAFYDALPERFTVYRGGYGVPPNMIGLGVCWTTSRDVAEWFARRGVGRDDAPIILSARVRKSDVLLAFATEHEVALRPARWRQLRCRRQTNRNCRPQFDWQPANPA
ncbi:hypothetical protein [Methylobacterium sp. PvR107]|uniref:hypothetical protein n=1 Tax=Methylobacterium sp. PvR107 TaxID=2806597 RepID=UPI001AE790F1|nr:hypothetical protein [Methylobacterium sp. PvR107]MBP1180910.1 hypothetical protein [Methylobacterium sp. PvR107]